MAETQTKWYWRRKRNQSFGYWEDIEGQVCVRQVGPIPLTEDGRPRFLPREDLERANEELETLRKQALEYQQTAEGWRTENQELRERMATARKMAEEAANIGKIEQDLENDQVRRMRQMGRCPVCGGEDPNG